VWDGKSRVDFNFSAFGIDPDEAWRLANLKGRKLQTGKALRCNRAHTGATTHDRQAGALRPHQLTALYVTLNLRIDWLDGNWRDGRGTTRRDKG
jgi:hypothetical protein